VWRDIQKNIIQLNIPKIKYIYSMLFSILSSCVVRRISPDVVIDNQPDTHFSSLLDNCPTIAIIHDIDEIVLRRSKIKAFILKSVLRKVRKVVVPSSLTKHMVKTFFSYPQHNIYVIPWGVDKKFSPHVNGSEVRKKLKLSDARILLFVGRVAPNKGIDILIEALSKVKTKFSSKLLIVGPTAAPELSYTYRDLLKLVRSLKLEEDVVFVGRVSESELPRYYAASDVYVQASNWGEGFGFSCLEAEASGKPVVCTEIFKKTGVVTDETAVLVRGNASDFANAILKLFDNPRLMRKYGRAGRKFAQNFSWERCCERIAKVIAEVAKGS